MKHVIRIEPDWLRIPLLCLLWPMSFIGYVLRSTLPARLGGHPRKRRLLTAGFYLMPVALFLAAWDGAFVPSR